MDKFELCKKLYRKGFSDRAIAEIVFGSRSKKSIVARWRNRCRYSPNYLPGGERCGPPVVISWCELLEAHGSRGFHNVRIKQEMRPEVISEKMKYTPWMMPVEMLPA